VPWSVNDSEGGVVHEAGGGWTARCGKHFELPEVPLVHSLVHLGSVRGDGPMNNEVETEDLSGQWSMMGSVLE